jgi:hypothetical protein
MFIVLRVEDRLPARRCLDAKAVDVNGHPRQVVPLTGLHRFPGQRIGVLGHADARTDASLQCGLLEQFPLRGLSRRFARLDATSDYVPVAAMFRNAVEEENLAPVPPRDEHGYFGGGAHCQAIHLDRDF